MKGFRESMIITAIVAALALPALAQQRPPSPSKGVPPTEAQRNEIRMKMEAIKVSRLTEELMLDEKTAATFIPVITALDRKRRALMRENRQTLVELRTQLNVPHPDESRLKAAVIRLEKNHHDIISLREKEISAAKEHLTVTQQARYFLFHQDFQREVRSMLEGARKGSGQGRGPGTGGAPPKSQP